MKIIETYLWFCVGLFIVALPLTGTAQTNVSDPQLRWYRGNTHTHTINSDGNASPDAVVQWYRENGYQFLVITDHEFLTNVGPLNALLGADGKFLVMPGQEITQYITGPDKARTGCHVNAINTSKVVMPIGATGVGVIGGRAPAGVSMSDTFTRNIAEVKAAGGLAQINHPNWQWSVHANDLVNVPDYTLYEVFNGLPDINNFGGTDENGDVMPSTEALWDVLLTRGQKIWAVATDDSHDYSHGDNPKYEGPGHGWIVVRADKLTPEALTASMQHGDFYASNGPALTDYSVKDKTISIAIKREAGTNTRFVTRFIGKGGKVLSEAPGYAPKYQIKGDEGYVRARITDSNGKMAWTQPVFVGAK